MFFSFFYFNSQFLVIPQQKWAKMTWRWQSNQLGYGWTLVPGEALNHTEIVKRHPKIAHED